MARKTRRSTRKGGAVAPRSLVRRMGSVASTLSSPAAAVSAAPAVERSLFNKMAEVRTGMEDRADRFKETYNRRLGSVKEALNPLPTEEEMEQFAGKRRRSRRKSKKITRRRK